jgi:hypothetical protein
MTVFVNQKKQSIRRCQKILKIPETGNVNKKYAYMLLGGGGGGGGM